VAGKIVGLRAMQCHQTTFGVGLFTGEKDLQQKNQLVRAIYGDKQVSSQTLRRGLQPAIMRPPRH
jgi:hypothetical protein